jgi:hypothetical protein
VRSAFDSAVSDAQKTAAAWLLWKTLEEKGNLTAEEIAAIKGKKDVDGGARRWLRDQYRQHGKERKKPITRLFWTPDKIAILLDEQSKSVGAFFSLKAAENSLRRIRQIEPGFGGDKTAKQLRATMEKSLRVRAAKAKEEQSKPAKKKWKRTTKKEQSATAPALKKRK